MSFLREQFTHCLAWSNAHPKFYRTREQIAEQSDASVVTRHNMLEC